MNSAILGFMTGVWCCGSVLAAGDDFLGAKPSPYGVTKERVSQLQIRFPEAMLKDDEPFQVHCASGALGYSSWADNDTLWTYNFKPIRDEAYADPHLPGGDKCKVIQSLGLSSAKGKTWGAGTLNYSVTTAGPHVINLVRPYDFKGLRETEPILFIRFNGDIDREKFFSANSGYLAYSKSHLPAEKIFLVPVPEDQEKKIYQGLFNLDSDDDNYRLKKNWVLATIRQRLKPGSQVVLTVEGVTSAYDASVVGSDVYKATLGVRPDFEARLQCASLTSPLSCLPEVDIQVVFNSQVKWSDVNRAYIEYIPFDSDGKTVRAGPVAKKVDGARFIDRAMNLMRSYLPGIPGAKSDDALVRDIRFDVKIEPETKAVVVLPDGLVDVDQRSLSKSMPPLNFHIGSMKEMITMPQPTSIYERAIKDVAMPVGVVNLNQTIAVLQTGTEQNWAPISDISQIIGLFREYAAREDERSAQAYESPMRRKALGLAASARKIQLTGKKNRQQILEMKFGTNDKGQVGGFYAAEISTPDYDKEQKRSYGDGVYYRNPKYILAQVTDLAVQIKKGSGRSLAWVTQLSTGQPVAQASVEIYNCRGLRVKTLTTDFNGVANFENSEWAGEGCVAPPTVYGPYFDEKEYYLVVRKSDDFTVTHSSWATRKASIYGAKGAFSLHGGSITDHTPFFHTIIGVNLVRPGQKVPVQIIARVGQDFGFLKVDPKDLPMWARISNSQSRDIYYDFPLAWQNGAAAFTWNVPSGASVQLGEYHIQLIMADQSKVWWPQSSGGIEVSEFKVPL